MSVNNLVLQARIPFDLELKNGDDEKRAVLGFAVSVQRNYKPQGEQYYPEDLLYCKAFGKTAIFADKYFEKGSHCLIEGEVRRDNDYEKDGQTIKGQMYVHVNSIHFSNGTPKKEGSNSGTPSKPPQKKNLNPIKKRSII